MSTTGPHLCLCGCDAQIGADSTFAPGHDSTYMWRVLKEDFGEGTGVSERFLDWYLKNRPRAS
ncbi:hypothetical protein [Streptomyces sp. NPDC102409]|uniref:hypothetical protein n=1 Tax=Streptomyces sp. NPDC102409 TaxID=3366172 RepID=UPI00380D7D2C